MGSPASSAGFSKFEVLAEKAGRAAEAGQRSVPLSYLVGGRAGRRQGRLLI